MGKETGSTSRLASGINIRIGQEIRTWVPSIKPNDYERAVLTNAIIDLYNASTIGDLKSLTQEIDSKKKPGIKGILVPTLTEKVDASYRKAKHDEKTKERSERKSDKQIIRDLINQHRVANPLGVARLDFSLQMTTFGNYCEKILNELINTWLDGKNVETEFASSDYL